MGAGLTATRVSKRYGGVQALDGAELDVVPGEIHAILGENGAGKSTLVKIIAGIVPLDEGEVRAGGLVPRAGVAAQWPGTPASPWSTRNCRSSPNSRLRTTCSLPACRGAPGWSR